MALLLDVLLDLVNCLVAGRASLSMLVFLFETGNNNFKKQREIST